MHAIGITSRRIETLSEKLSIPNYESFSLSREREEMDYLRLKHGGVRQKLAEETVAVKETSGFGGWV